MVIIALSWAFGFGQKRPSCRIGTTEFKCPAGFVKLPNVDSETRLFRRAKKTANLFVVVSVPSGMFDDSTVKKELEKYYANTPKRDFQWKAVKNPLTMEIDSKYERSVSASFGFWDKFLLELKLFHFSIKDKKLVIGYVTNWGESPLANRQLFEEGEGFADTAAGCNEVAALLESITKEFNKKGHSCTLTELIEK